MTANFHLGRTFTCLVSICLMLLYNINGWAQTRTIHIPQDARMDTSFWYKHQQELCTKLGLEQIISSECDYHFRLWTSNQVLDVCKDGQHTKAMLTHWTEEYAPFDEKATGRIFKKTVLLDSIAIQIDTLVHLSGIKNIPDQSTIAGWEQELDGMTYMIEHADDSNYYFKSYWSPNAQSERKEVLSVQKFHEDLMLQVNASEHLRQFTFSIPFQCWYNGGPSTTCKVLTRKQLKQYKRERDKYRKTPL